MWLFMSGVIIITFLASFIGIIIVFLSKRFAIDESVYSDIENRLPNINCGGCGYKSCYEMAIKAYENPEEVIKCRPLKKEKQEELVEYLKNNNA